MDPPVWTRLSARACYQRNSTHVHAIKDIGHGISVRIVAASTTVYTIQGNICPPPHPIYFHLKCPYCLLLDDFNMGQNRLQVYKGE